MTGDDDASFVAFVEATSRRLLRVARLMLVDEARAEDVVQDALARMYPKWHRLADENPTAYARRAVVNGCLSVYRSARRQAVSPEAIDGVDRASSDFALASDERDAMWRVVKALPQKQRAVIVLRYYEDATDEAIAQILGCRESTVRSQAGRALEHLRASLDREEAAR